MKTLFAFLGKLGHQSEVYVHGSFLLRGKYLEHFQSIKDTIQLLKIIGFTIHPEKSVLIPIQKLELLGCIIHTIYTIYKYDHKYLV